MWVKNKKPFSVGVIFSISFLGVLLLIFSQVFMGKNGLQFADDSFNKLAKGSSYFIPKVSRSVEKFTGKPLVASIKVDKAEDGQITAKLFTAAGAKVSVKDKELTLEGDLGVILQSALRDADAMYKNSGKAVSERYGYDEKKVMQNWWQTLGKIEKGMKKEKRVAEAKIIADVMKKAVEPGYNFYQIDANKVSEHAGMMSGLLVFYVLYTMWWGYAIFYLFEGLGLSMKKAKVKKEA
jgi:hypothetical protein